MVHPKYSPEEALQRMKLMMEYDSSKTYTENKVIVENKQQLNEEPITLLGIGLAWWIGAAVAAAGGTAAGFASEYSTASIDEKIKLLFSGCDKNEPGKKRKTMTEVEHAQIAGLFREAFAFQMFGAFGGGTDLDLIKEALKLLETKGNVGDFCAVREVFGKSTFENELISELNTKELGWVVRTFEVLLAKSKPGSIPTKDQETAQTTWWIENFPCLQYTDSFVDPIEIQTDRYGMTFVGVNFKVKGEVKQYNVDRNGKIYIPSGGVGQHKFTGKKVNCATETRVSVVGESVKKKKLSEQADLGNLDLNPVDADLGGSNSGGTPTPTSTPRPNPGPSFVNCSGVYRIGCKSDVITKVQGCLGGLVQDGKFGPKTEGKLKEKFPDLGGVFRDNEVDRICNKETESDELIPVNQDEL